MTCQRDYNAEYYDLFESQEEDIAFYRSLLKQTDHVLELGCGSGRVTLPLASHVKAIVGVDDSGAMLARAQAKCAAGNVRFVTGDITCLSLNQKFDCIISPFRVIQCLTEAHQIDGFFEVIHRHLAEDGIAFIDAYNPFLDKAGMAREWVKTDEIPCGESQLPNGDIVKCSVTQRHIDGEGLITYPEMVYRRYAQGVCIDKHVNPIAMRYWYPEEFEAMAKQQGFVIQNRWGGYQDEVYGEGPELVLALMRSKY